MNAPLPIYRDITVSQRFNLLIAKCSVVSSKVGHLEGPVGIAVLIDLANGTRRPGFGEKATGIIGVGLRFPDNAKAVHCDFIRNNFNRSKKIIRQDLRRCILQAGG